MTFSVTDVRHFKHNRAFPFNGNPFPPLVGWLVVDAKGVLRLLEWSELFADDILPLSGWSEKDKNNFLPLAEWSEKVVIEVKGLNFRLFVGFHLVLALFERGMFVLDDEKALFFGKKVMSKDFIPLAEWSEVLANEFWNRCVDLSVSSLAFMMRPLRGQGMCPTEKTICQSLRVSA